MAAIATVPYVTGKSGITTTSVADALMDIDPRQHNFPIATPSVTVSGVPSPGSTQ